MQKVRQVDLGVAEFPREPLSLTINPNRPGIERCKTVHLLRIVRIGQSQNVVPLMIKSRYGASGILNHLQARTDSGFRSARNQAAGLGKPTRPVLTNELQIIPKTASRYNDVLCPKRSTLTGSKIPRGEPNHATVFSDIELLLAQTNRMFGYRRHSRYSGPTKPQPLP